MWREDDLSKRNQSEWMRSEVAFLFLQATCTSHKVVMLQIISSVCYGFSYSPTRAAHSCRGPLIRTMDQRFQEYRPIQNIQQKDTNGMYSKHSLIDLLTGKSNMATDSSSLWSNLR